MWILLLVFLLTTISPASAEDNRIRFAKRDIGVYIADGWRNEQIRGYIPDFRLLVMKALDEWTHATQGKLTWHESNSPSEADITVYWVPNEYSFTAPNPDLAVSQCKYKFRFDGGYKILDQSQVEFSTHYGEYRMQDLVIWPGVIYHEIGHALGIANSNSKNDVMADIVTTNSLSDADKDAVFKKYL